MSSKRWSPIVACSLLASAFCSSGAQSAQKPISTIAHGFSRATAGSGLTGEVLTGNARLRAKPCTSDHSVTKFKARGTATGPYPGKFTAKGVWTVTLSSSHLWQWTFQESFKIRSGKTVIKGTVEGGFEGEAGCYDFGNGPLYYSAGSYGDSVTMVNISGGSSGGSLSQTFY